MPSGTKWDDKAERDLFLAMRVAESGFANVSKDTAKKVVELMELMGYNLTPRTVGERWRGALSGNIKASFSKVLEGAGARSVGGLGSLGSTTGGGVRRGARLERVKDEAREEDEEKKPIKYEINSDDEVIVREPAPKRQKKN